jgi:hypothetical protein
MTKIEFRKAATVLNHTTDCPKKRRNSMMPFRAALGIDESDIIVICANRMDGYSSFYRRFSRYHLSLFRQTFRYSITTGLVGIRGDDEFACGAMYGAPSTQSASSIESPRTSRRTA